VERRSLIGYAVGAIEHRASIKARYPREACYHGVYKQDRSADARAEVTAGRRVLQAASYY